MKNFSSDNHKYKVVITICLSLLGLIGLIGTAPNLSATVLDTSEDLNNLYRTISRKRILNKVYL